MVLVLKKEVVKTASVVEKDEGVKYRQLLVRTLHQCSLKFPDIAGNIIPVVRFLSFFSFHLLFSLFKISYHILTTFISPPTTSVSPPPTTSVSPPFTTSVSPPFTTSLFSPTLSFYFFVLYYKI